MIVEHAWNATRMEAIPNPIFVLSELAALIVYYATGTKRRWTPACAALRRVSRLLNRLVSVAVERYDCVGLVPHRATDVLPSWPSLNKLKVVTTHPDCTGGAWLQALTRLRTLSFKCDYPIPIVQLTRHTNLRELRFNTIYNVERRDVDTSCLMTWLTGIKFSARDGSKHGDTNAAMQNYWLRLTGLESIVMRYQSVGMPAERIVTLRHLTNLRKLVPCTPVNALFYVGDALTTLTRLETLGMTTVTPMGIYERQRFLWNLPRLTQLDLRGTQGYCRVDGLLKMVPTLRRIKIDRFSFSEQWRRELLAWAENGETSNGVRVIYK